MKKKKHPSRRSKGTIHSSFYVVHTTPSRFSSLLHLLLIFSIIVALFVFKPHVLPSVTHTPQLQHSLALLASPTLTPSKNPEKKSLFVPRAEAAEQNNDYCVNLPVLFYHHVEPLSEAQESGHAQFTVDNLVFESQMNYLKENDYMTVSVDTIIDAILNKKPLSKKIVALTFDDGYSDMYGYAYPVLKKFGFFGNFAIPTGLIGQEGYMNWDQLTEIARDPGMHIYNHTVSHADLLHNPSHIEGEIAGAQSDIQTRLGLRSNIFFYPYGSFNDHVIASLRARGYIAAFSTLPGTLQCESSLMQLSRTRIGNAPLSLYGL